MSFNVDLELLVSALMHECMCVPVCLYVLCWAVVLPACNHCQEQEDLS
jgi:hypothetical protein